MKKSNRGVTRRAPVKSRMFGDAPQHQPRYPSRSIPFLRHFRTERSLSHYGQEARSTGSLSSGLQSSMVPRRDTHQSYLWQVPGKRVSIVLDLAVVDRITTLARAEVQGLRGFLLGRTAR